MKYMMIAALALLISTSAIAAEAPYRKDSKKSDFFGFDRYDFKLGDHTCYVIEPKKFAQGKPWIWRARFDSKAFPAFDQAMLAQGYTVAKVDVGGLFGGPRAMEVFDEFYNYCTQTLGLSRRPTLEGLSRGGLVIFNWSIKNPDKVSCVYADAAVCDFKSWPGGKGAGKGWPDGWKACLKQYGLTEQQAITWKGNPVDQVHLLAKAQVPVICVVGDADPVVPAAENSLIMETRYNAHIPEGGINLKVISKPGVGHHPHSLKDPTPIVEFVQAAVKRTAGQ